MQTRFQFVLGLTFLILQLCTLDQAWGETPQTPTPDQALTNYFRAETEKLASRCLEDIQSLAQWQGVRERYRQQLLEMLGLSPLPEKADLKPVITGKVEHEQFTVENLQFQSMPGLYVTGN